jgi:hypothetical protein
MAKLICGVVLNGEETLRSITTVAGAVPTLVKTTPGIGKPFWYFASIPAGKVVGADMTNAPIADGDTAVNLASMNAITALPQEVLIYDPPLSS